MRCIRVTDFSRRIRSSRGWCSTAGLIWVGPPPQVMETLGNKVAARNLAVQRGCAGGAGDGSVAA